MQRTLRDLLPIAAAAAAAALGVAVIVTPAVSYLDGSLEGSLSGLASDIPASVSAPVKRLLSPDDITVRVRPGRPAPSIALANSAVSPTELVTGQAAPDRRPGDPAATARRGAGVVGPIAPGLAAAEPASPAVPADVEAPAPAPVGPILAAVPDDLGDAVSATKQRKRPSRPLRDAASTTVFTISGAKTEPEPKSQSEDSDAGAMSLASFSADDDSGKSNGAGKSDDKSNDKSNDKDHPGQGRGQDDEAKKRNPKPEMK